MSSKKHTKSNGQKGNLKTWVTNNWVSLFTLLISSLALWVSFQSNQLTKANSSSFINIVSEVFEAETMMILGCQHKNSYYVHYYVVNEYTFSNTGGRAVSLVKVNLHRGDDEYKVKVFMPQSFDARSLEAPPDLDFYHGLVFTDSLGTAIIVPTKAEPINLPLSIDSGSGEKWLFQGDTFDIFDNIDKARQVIASLRDEKNIFSWEFTFSDGSIVKSDKIIVSYSYGDISQDFPECQNEP